MCKVPLQNTLGFLFLFFFFVSKSVFAGPDVESTLLNVDLIVEGCNNNLICEPLLGETTSSCPLDCPYIPPTPTSTPTSTQPVIASTVDGSSSRSDRKRPEVLRQDEISAGPILVQRFVVSPGVTDVSLSWYTPALTISSVRIGYSDDYSVAASAEFGYRTDHFFRFTNLEPNQRYAFEIFMTDPQGVQQKIIGTFQTNARETLPSIQQAVLEKPSNIRVILEDGTANISWKNPEQQTFEYVRIVRTLNQPATRADEGIAVYEGRAEKVSDTGLVARQLYYYTFFARHNAGLYTGPVSIPVRYFSATETERIVDEPTPVFGGEIFNLMYFSFSQQTEPLVWYDKKMYASPGEPLVIRFAKTDLFSPLDDMYMSVLFLNHNDEPVRRVFQKFIFRTDLGMYETVLTGIHENQRLLFTIERNVLDEYGNTTIEKVIGEIIIGAFSTHGQQFMQGTTCKGFATGVMHVRNVLYCTMPWPVILLCVFFTSILFYIRKKIFV